MTTDEPDEQLDTLAPADEARIRALLSDARETDPMPAPVATRLDEAIAGLAAERTHALDSGYESNVRPLVRTRRHRVVAVLGAAAAVAVVGLAVGTFFDDDDRRVPNSTSADTGVDRGTAAYEAEADAEDAEEPNRVDPTDTAATDQTPELTVTSDPLGVHSRRLVRDLAGLRDQFLPDPRSEDYTRSPTYVPSGFTCDTAPVANAVVVGVRYDGAPAYVAFHSPMGDSQVVDVLQCGTGDVLRSTTLPVAD
ncbi:hypothetical protein [Nocardioides antri]|uniref:Uncharacterized protein n=1 Tax=Nocardioides antri TaxID=2607659 RepID=A0A5B1M4N4_9ACTN|nr:hypothetical protein [Nocardioides antri]KAA1426757.1 hypothetical protein F0U47_12370 [Nocardioides antri]